MIFGSCRFSRFFEHLISRTCFFCLFRRKIRISKDQVEAQTERIVKIGIIHVDGLTQGLRMGIGKSRCQFTEIFLYHIAVIGKLARDHQRLRVLQGLARIFLPVFLGRHAEPEAKMLAVIGRVGKSGAEGYVGYRQVRRQKLVFRCLHPHHVYEIPVVYADGLGKQV